DLIEPGAGHGLKNLLDSAYAEHVADVWWLHGFRSLRFNRLPQLPQHPSAIAQTRPLYKPRSSSLFPALRVKPAAIPDSSGSSPE
ncbi:MAG: hypothetical protein Q8L91_14295, partial [Polaromonas sp.]|nr:hypothetical protein [Polaromonas sp.]